MRIELDSYIFTMQMWKERTEAFKACDFIDSPITKTLSPDIYKIFWGNVDPLLGRHSVMETGFFHDAAHLDTIGLYQYSSLCTPQALKEIENFDAKVSAEEILNQTIQKTGHSSKYPQGQDPEWNSKFVDWEGVVLASQNPTDRSIRSVFSPEQYYQFIEDACKFYGKDLFIKLHPWNSGEVGERLRSIASKHGVQAAKINHRIISKCKFCLVFNSTFSVDCFLRNVPVAQYAPGYFYQNPAVQYTGFTFPTEIKTNIGFGQKTCDFLMWKYCFDHSMPAENWIKMFEVFANSREMFPMPEGLSYAGYNLRKR
jgi:hypothetical protein